jgi:hypothetical protein
MQYPTIAQPQYAFAPTMMAKGGKVQAENVRAQGRGEDTMLVHMTPGEVGGLQALAMQHGGSLSINPNTGMPEAGFLKNLLPTLIGAAITIGSGGAIDPATAGMIVGGGTTIATGDLGQGLMAGLGAYGGAGLGAGASAAGAAAPSATSGAVGSASANAAQAAGTQSAAETARLTAANQVAGVGAPPPTIMDNFAQAGRGIQNLLTGQEGSLTKFIGTPSVSANEKTGQQAVQATGLGGKMGILKTAGALAAPAAFAVPEYAPPAQEEEEPYEGPYTPTRRTVSYPGEEQRRRTSEFMYFNPSNPVPFAEGGDVSSGLSMTAPEAQVYSQIANVQQLAGLPAIDTSRFNIIPSTPSVAERVGLVYNPIDGSYIGPGAGGGAERSYGFQSLGNQAVPESGRAPGAASGPLFFQPVGGFPKPLYGAFGLSGPLYGSGFARVMDRSDPDEYKSKFEQIELDESKPLNMADYSFDPILGGYIKTPRFTPSSDDMGYYSYNYEKGGSVPQLESGGFVLTKKAVDGLGKGDNKRGQEVASRGLGAIPIKGPGTGTSDSIKTTIDGKVPARIANGEAYVPKKHVAKNGGAKKFYALMKKAERRA